MTVDLAALGFSIAPDFIDEPFEAALIETAEAIDDGGRGYDGLNGRYVARYGYNYVAPHQRLTDAPSVFYDGPCARFGPEGSGHTAITVNRYLPGAFITPHVDNLAFEDTIFIVSLLGECEMVLTPPGGRPHNGIVVVVPRRSLITMTGVVRKTWMHGTEGAARPRISIVYRRLKDDLRLAD